MGVIVNVITILIGGIIGILFNRGIPEKISQIAMTALGISTIFIGIQGAMKGENTIVLILSMVFGAIVGTLLDIDGKINGFAKSIQKIIVKEGKEDNRIADGFMTAMMFYCVGAMAILGPINSGLIGDHSILYTKSILDLVSTIMLCSAMGIGPVFAVIPMLILEGGIYLLSGLLQGLLNDPALINEINCAGNLLIMVIGMNILGITKIKVADFLPAVACVPVMVWLVSFLPL